MKKRYFAKTRKVLQRSFGLRFYERLSSFCYSKLRENYLSPSRKIIFLFLLMLCAEITFSLGAPVSRSIRINVPYATTLDITECRPKLFSFGKSFTHKADAFFVVTLKHSSFMPQAYSYNRIIPASIQAFISILFASFTKLLMRDDRIVTACNIKFSPVKAQGPPFFKYPFTASYLVSSLSQYLYYCAISIIVFKKRHSFFAGILAIFTTLHLQFLKLKITDITRRYSRFFIFPGCLRGFMNSRCSIRSFWLFVFWFSKISFKKEVKKVILISNEECIA